MAHVACCGNHKDWTDFKCSSSPTFEQVFPKEFYRSGSETVEFVGIRNVAKTLLEKTLQWLNTECPLGSDFDHLKRVNRDGILLWKRKEDIEESVEFPPSLRDASTETVTVYVPRFPVFTKSQFEASNKIWPIRITTPLIDISEPIPDAFTDLHWRRLHELMNRRGVPMGESHSPISSVLCCIVSPDADIVVYGSHAAASSPLHFKHAVLDACTQLGPLSDYLATGYSAYLLGEPCVMCAMALLHSRVKEVFFLDSGKQPFGGFGSSVSIHCNKQLNHRFNVWKVTAER